MPSSVFDLRIHLSLFININPHIMSTALRESDHVTAGFLRKDDTATFEPQARILRFVCNTSIFCFLWRREGSVSRLVPTSTVRNSICTKRMARGCEELLGQIAVR